MFQQRAPQEVNYRPGQPPMVCANCTNFIPEDMACLAVSGRIEPNMVCDLFAPQQNVSAPGDDLAMLEDQIFGGPTGVQNG